MAGELSSFEGEFLRPMQEWSSLPVLPIDDSGNSIEALRIEIGRASELLVSTRRYVLVSGVVHSFGIALAQTGSDWKLEVPAGVTDESVSIESHGGNAALVSAGAVWKERVQAGDHLVFERGRGWRVETAAGGKIGRREAQKRMDEAQAGIVAMPGAL